MSLKASIAALVLSASVGWAHPGHEKVYQHAPQVRDLGHCDKAFNHPEFVKRTVEIQGEELARLRRAIGLEPANAPKIHERDYISVSKIDHHSNKTVTQTTDPATLFADAGACILMPAVDQGPLC